MIASNPLRSILLQTPLHRQPNSTLFCYTSPDSFPSLSRLLGFPIERELLLSPSLRTVARVVALFAMRVSECLQLQVRDVISGDRVVVEGKKKSGSYIIWLPHIQHQIDTTSGVDESAFLFPFPYIHVYRHFVRVGLVELASERLNHVVSHAGRYRLISEIVCNRPLERPGDLLHHRRENTVSYYLPKKGG